MQAADRIVTAAEMAEIDRRAQEDFGIPGMLLMENAGQKAWTVVRNRVHAGGERDAPQKITFVAGNGNNGGDALVMARQAAIEGETHVLVITVKRELKGLTQQHWEILERLGTQRLVWSDDHDAVRAALQDSDWIVDGIAGTGLSGALRGPAATLVDVINGSSAPVVAVDVPSGLGDDHHAGDPVVRAHMTVVTGYLKSMLYEGENRTTAGDICTVDPGFPSSLIADAQVVSSRIALLPILSDHPVPIDSDVHKGQRGRVLVVGGSAGTAGAAVLSAEGAGAAGAGMVRVLTSSQGVAAVLTRNPSFMAGTLSSGGIEDSEKEAVSWADAVVLGPGWTTLTDSTLSQWLSLCDEVKTAVVLDAAALRVLAGKGKAWECLLAGTVPVTLTPHVGEWRALAAAQETDEGLRAALERFPQRPGLTVVVKSSVTWVRHDTGEIDVLDGRTAVLATAGSGDVLSGVLAGAVARVAAAKRETPEMIRDALRWGLARHLAAGRRLENRCASPSAADIVAQIGAGAGACHE